MSATLSQRKNELIKEIAQRQGFDKFTMEVTSGSMKGDGYLGTIYIVRIEGNNKHLHLIVKSALTGEKLRETNSIKNAYEREIYLYKVVFPEFSSFSQKVGISNNFCETAKYYGSLSIDKEECIILENLAESNFKLWNRKLPMNKEHVELAFKTYAKFHGTGLALKFLRPEKFEDLAKNLTNVFQKVAESEDDKKQFEESVKVGFAIGFKAVADDEKAKYGLIKFAQNCRKFIYEDLSKTDTFSTILHGDSWCNNMMFTYNNAENPTRPTEIRLLDWQMAHNGSPILDLSYFFYTCVSDDILYKLKDFLIIYHQDLSKIIEEVGLNPDDVLTYEELETQWKIYSKYGLIRTLLMMKFILSESEEAPDLDEIAKSGKNILESLSNTDSTNMEAINRRTAKLIVFMNEQGYL